MFILEKSLWHVEKCSLECSLCFWRSTNHFVICSLFSRNLTCIDCINVLPWSLVSGNATSMEGTSRRLEGWKRVLLGYALPSSFLPFGSPLVNCIPITKITAPAVWLSTGSHFFLFLFSHLCIHYFHHHGSSILISCNGVIICYIIFIFKPFFLESWLLRALQAGSDTSWHVTQFFEPSLTLRFKTIF